jgi:ParB family chromosome partitioning protein
MYLPEYVRTSEIRPPRPVVRVTDRCPLVVEPHPRGGLDVIKGFTAYERAVGSSQEWVHVFVRVPNPDNPLDRLGEIQTLKLDDPIEEAQAFRDVRDSLGISQRRLARMAGIPQYHISRREKLLRLPEQLQQEVRDGRLRIEHALRLAG